MTIKECLIELNLQFHSFYDQKWNLKYIWQIKSKSFVAHTYILTFHEKQHNRKYLAQNLELPGLVNTLQKNNLTEDHRQMIQLWSACSTCSNDYLDILVSPGSRVDKVLVMILVLQTTVPTYLQVDCTLVYPLNCIKTQNNKRTSSHEHVLC